jgi:hypothetical protein
MDKMHALQSKLIQNIYTKPLAIKQVTQENFKKNFGIDKKMVTLRPRSLSYKFGILDRNFIRSTIINQR